MARLDKRGPRPASGDALSSADPLPESVTDAPHRPVCPAEKQNAGDGGVREVASPDEVLAQYCHECLVRQEGEAAVRARAFLESAGMNWSSVSDLPVGVLDSAVAAMRHAAAAGVSPADWKARRISPKLEGCLVGPIRECSGEIVTFWARATDPDSRCYLFRDRWDHRPIAFGMERLTRSRPSHVFAVERILDALILRSWGVEPVLAFARRFDQVLPEVWRDLTRWGILQVTLLPVGPEVPPWVLHGARDQARRSTMRPELWSIPPRRIAPSLGRWAAELGEGALFPWIRDHRVPLLGHPSDFQRASAGVTVAEPPAADRRKDAGGAMPTEAADCDAGNTPVNADPAKEGKTKKPVRASGPGICPKHGGPLDGCFCFD